LTMIPFRKLIFSLSSIMDFGKLKEKHFIIISA